MKEYADDFSVSLSATSAPTMERTIQCTPDELEEVLEMAMSSDVRNEYFGNLFPSALRIKGVGRYMSSTEGLTLSQVINSLPQFGVGDDFAQGGYRVTITLSSDPNAALNSESGGSSPPTHQPPGGGVMTVSRSHEVESIPLQPIGLANVPNAPDLRINMLINSITYNYRWTKIPQIDWSLLDYNIGRLDESKFTLPIYGKEVDPLHIYMESVDDSLDIGYESSRFTVQPALTIVLKERLIYSWEDYFFLNASDEPEPFQLEGVIPRGARLAEVFGVA